MIDPARLVGPERLVVARAGEADVVVASSILTEAAHWLIEIGQPLWKPEELLPERVLPLVRDGLLYLGRRGGEAVGTICLQWEDHLFWPDVPALESGFVHRLAVRRSVAGTGVAPGLLEWASRRVREAGRTYLRFDCSALHPGLQAWYESRGFDRHSERQVGPHRVVRYERRVGER